MKLVNETTDNYLWLDKPSGFSTHSPDIDKWGIKEILETELGLELFVAHRLDKTTTGNLIFPRNRQFTQSLSNQFAQQEVKKVYRFVTHKPSQDSSITMNDPIGGKSARTQFQRIKRSPFFELWEASPETGRMHQIRIHAQLAGIPILGDTEYGGKIFPHLCLHNSQIRFKDLDGIEITKSSPTPLFFDRLGLLRDSELIHWLSEADRRQRLYNLLGHQQECLRLVHSDQIRIDQFGEQIWIYWYKNHPPDQRDHERIETFSRLLKKRYFLKVMLDRGKTPTSAEGFKSSDWTENWTAQEGLVTFKFSSELGQSPGLFLDQRKNRQIIFSSAQEKSVLNLFSYTCGFSLCAALGGALEVTSVDVSSRFLDYGKELFKLNGIQPDKYKFYDMDVLKFLKSMRQKKRTFDIIICDPPSFGRSPEGVFKLENEFELLIRSCWDCLNMNGRLLFSTNYEKWDEAKIKSQISKIISGFQFETHLPEWDYELPNEPRLMKYFWIKKISI